MALKVWKISPPGIKVLYFSSFLMNLGFYALIPYLTLYLTGSFAWSMAMAGILLGVRQFSQQGLTFIGGLVSDRIGCKPTLVIGVFIRSLGFLSFAFCTEAWQFFLAAIVSGLGGALFEPSFQAAFARLAPDEHRKALFSFKNVVTNVGIVASTLLGSLLSSVDFFFLALVAGALYIVIGFVCLFLLPNLEVEITQVSWMQDIHEMVKDKPFVIYTIILIGYYYLYMQLFLTIPKLAQTLTGDSQAVAYIYATISGSVILLQMHVAKYLEKFTQRMTLIGIGSLLMGTGLFMFSFSNSLWELLINAFIFALGTMISGPVLMDVVPILAPREKLASYYGFNGYSLAIGGALSTSLGGWIYDLGLSLNWKGLPWMVCLLVSLLVAWSLHNLEGKHSQRFIGSLKKSI
ncbi:MFS transporter [Ammoniphilus sp. CFH 90114]|uniref:MDR family MFS transporter n=1 Tax=Ammoniphilus sp. CFH 90114 TaxID=2493665 RepID=UPI001F0BE1C3|nr:MFS transporter [Ammoniphilus sp. CFH 90114]